MSHLSGLDTFFQSRIVHKGFTEVAKCLLRFRKLLKEEHPEIDYLIIKYNKREGYNK